MPGQLVATDPMGSCLAATRTLYNQSRFLGTEIALYTPDGRPLWRAVVKLNATALATNCVEVAVGGQDGSFYVLKDGRVMESQKLEKPVYALAYTREGRLAVGTGDPLSGFTAYVDRCGNVITAVKADAPYLVINGVKLRGGLAPMLAVPASASQDCRTFIYAVYDTLYNKTSPLIKLPSPVLAVAVSGDGRTAAAIAACPIPGERQSRCLPSAGGKSVFAASGEDDSPRLPRHPGNCERLQDLQAHRQLCIFLIYV